MNLLSDENHKISLIGSQYKVRKGLNPLSQQAITLANIYPFFCRHMEFIGHNELMTVSKPLNTYSGHDAFCLPDRKRLIQQDAVNFMCIINPSPTRQNGRHFGRKQFQCNFLNENDSIRIFPAICSCESNWQ